MTSELLSEHEFRRRVAFWLLDNDRGACLPCGVDREEYAEQFRLPDFDYTHTHSCCDKEGDLITMLRGEISLSDWQTRNGREPRKLVFYKVLKTFIDTPEVEPYPMGYIIVL